MIISKKKTVIVTLVAVVIFPAVAEILALSKNIASIAFFCNIHQMPDTCRLEMMRHSVPMSRMS